MEIKYSSAFETLVGEEAEGDGAVRIAGSGSGWEHRRSEKVSLSVGKLGEGGGRGGDET